MDADKTTYAPFVLLEYDHKPGTYCLMLSDDHMAEVMEVFDQNGRYGNGYGWADVTIGMIRNEAPDLEKRIDFDPEAGTFVACGEDLEALQQLGEMLSEAFANRIRLAKLVTHAPWEWD